MDGITTSINSILKNLIKNFNTLLDCPVRFSGEYDKQKIHNFIEYIEYYKRIKCIADEQALQELQYLLLDQAHSWWLRRKPHLNTWSEALTVLENQYSKRRPAHVIYTEILKHHYGDYKSKDDFIDDKIELFCELSQPDLRDDNKLDIIYALLPSEIQNKVKIVNIKSIKDLKEQLKLIKLDNVETPSNEENIAANLINKTTTNKESPEIQNKNGCKNNSECSQANQKSTGTVHPSPEIIEDPERDPIIKVRRTQDLMPQDIKEEQETPIQQEFVENDNVSTNTNNVSQSNNDDFQIDNDIMNQINNIIDESEMNIRAMNNNQNTPAFITEPTNTSTSLEFLGFNIEAIQQEVAQNKSPSLQVKSPLKTTKKVKVRCSYCRHFNHTAQVCFKKAKHMKLFPEKFLTAKSKESNESLPPQNTEDTVMESLPLNSTNNTTTNANTISTSSTEATVTPPHTLNQISTTSIPFNPLLVTSPNVTSSPTVILNNVSEKSINPVLTTKLIAPINGKTSNKILSAKLRCINTPSPKCHQCGTVGFYKSICPNCSPIYNNNNNHNQYSK